MNLSAGVGPTASYKGTWKLNALSHNGKYNCHIKFCWSLLCNSQVFGHGTGGDCISAMSWVYIRAFDSRQVFFITKSSARDQWLLHFVVWWTNWKGICKRELNNGGFCTAFFYRPGWSGPQVRECTGHLIPLQFQYYHGVSVPSSKLRRESSIVSFCRKCVCDV